MTGPRPVLLERRYRTVLRLLPAAYRAEREEEMVATFLEVSGDTPDEENPRPRWGEIASVAALAVRVRLGGGGPRSVVWGETVRLVALMATGYHAAMSAYGLAGLGDVLSGRPGSAAGITSPVGVALGLLESLWIVAYAAAVRGHARHAKIAALVAGGASLSWILTGLPSEWPEAAAMLMVVVPVLALLAGFHGDAARTVRPWWLVALPVAVAVPLYGVHATLAGTPEVAVPLWPWIDLGGVAALALLVAGAVVWARRRPPSASLSLAVTGTLLLTWRLPLTYPLEGNEDLWLPSAAQCVLLAAVVVPLLVTGWRGLPGRPESQPAR